ncbi:MAG TPA: hypothetical protein VFX65_14745 [Candidatus Limnocylindrales bacterium]|jgi:hypothetical protein|nr:hypothetical protein [Candidatus Limnocylindrales bacterium]
MMKKRGPGEGLTRHPGPGEGRKAGGGGPLEVDVEGHALGDILTRPIDNVTGQPKTGHDGIVNMPRTGGEALPDPDSH